MRSNVIETARKIVVMLCLSSFLFANNLQLVGDVVAQTAHDPAEGSNESETMTQSVSSDSTIADQVYKIEPGDVLEIVVLGEEELSRTLVVMRNGSIALPLMGEVNVGGLTAEQAEELIVQKLKKYYTQPVVSVILKSPTQPQISIFGEVLKPGAIDYQRGLRLTDYIALAGGPTNKANLGKVKVVRFAAGSPIVETVNVNDIINKGMVAKDYELKSGDWMYVSKKFTINWGILLQIATLTLTALTLYITLDRQ